MKTRILSLITTLVLAATLNSVSAASFPDISNGSPRDTAISYLVSQNVINGYLDGTFKPVKNISRAEIVKMLVTSLAVTDEELNANIYENYSSKNYTYAQFKDVQINEWYAKYIVYAYKNGWIQGY